MSGRQVTQWGEKNKWWGGKKNPNQSNSRGQVVVSKTRLNESPCTQRKGEKATTATTRRRGRPGGRLLCMFGKWPDESFSEEKEESNWQERALHRGKKKKMQSNFAFNPERACTYLNATEAVWRNEEQQWRWYLQETISQLCNLVQRPGWLQLTQLDFQDNFIQVWTEAKVLRWENMNSSSFYSKEQNTHSPSKGRIFLAGLDNFKGPFGRELGLKVEIRIEFL